MSKLRVIWVIKENNEVQNCDPSFDWKVEFPGTIPSQAWYRSSHVERQTEIVGSQSIPETNELVDGEQRAHNAADKL